MTCLLLVKWSTLHIVNTVSEYTAEFWASKNNLYISLFLGSFFLSSTEHIILFFSKELSFDLVLNFNMN